jgi:AcrR family transcriptional regulator
MSSRGLRAERTRDALVSAAKEVFREQAFHEAKIADIAARAGVAHGSFYTHFDSKEAIFSAVADQVMSEGFLRTSTHRQLGDAAGPAEQIEAANRRYFAFFRENAQIMASIETLSAVNDELSTQRHESVMAYTHRAASAIRRWKSDADEDASLDVETVAYCLNAMVERIAHMLHVLGVTAPSEEESLRTLTAIWVAALELGVVNDGVGSRATAG